MIPHRAHVDDAPIYLYFGSLVPDDPRDGGQGGELVRSHLGVHPGQVGEKGGLAHRGEAWQRGERSVS